MDENRSKSTLVAVSEITALKQQTLTCIPKC